MCLPSYQDFDTLDEAQTACVVDEKCIAIQDYYCDGVGFKLCKEGSITEPKTSNSCIYSKGRLYWQAFIPRFIFTARCSIGGKHIIVLFRYFHETENHPQGI